jgi:hypothetical protein
MRSIDFATEVHPVLETRCKSCHTGDNAQAGFRVSSREDLLRGGSSGPAIVPGKGADSLLIQKITGRRGMRMPPAGSPLSDDAIVAIRQWIDQGAAWGPATNSTAGRLAAIAPRNPLGPAMEMAGNPIDRFIKSGSAAGDAVFARRAYLDVWGLLPPPEELTAFVGSKEPGKRAALIDRLLADREKYAEHWISYWNDLLRNDEGVIYHGERKSITNWLLDALRTNMPYNAMVRALLNPAKQDDPEGFLIGVNWRGVVSASQSPPMQAAQNSAQVFLGMNLKCAACHDSFVNRWKLRDTFGLAAMFSAEKLELVRCDVPTGKMAEARFPIEELKVPFSETVESRREAAAEWFTSKENGRFARTIVNRYWRLLLGRGIVEPIDDMDAEPWSQDLLDALAFDFAQHGYDLQQLLRRIMTSGAYQMPAVLEEKAPARYTFRGPLLRRLTAEQFEDAISQATGDWRVRVPRDEAAAIYAREWRLKSDPLSRVLGRPIRDQVYTERATQATTLQGLEMTNGPLLSERLERAAHAMIGELKPAAENRFDSKLVRGGATPVDIDISGAKDLYLVIEDVDSYDASRIVAGWADVELIGPEGAIPLSSLGGPAVASHQFELAKGESAAGFKSAVPSILHWRLGDKPFTRFRARAIIDESSRKSDISPALRFFVFTEAPEADRMVRVEGGPPMPAPKTQWTSAELVDRLYLQLFSRAPSAAERSVAMRALGEKPAGAAVEDLLWAMLVSPEFQFVR